MGMFDYIKFEDISILPKPEGFELNMEGLEFQTKSLDNALYLYEIGQDKYLYREDGPFKEDQKEPRRRCRVDFHGIINFGAYEVTDLIDYHLEYEAKFTDNILKNVKLLSYKTYNHESKEARIKQIIEKSKKENNRLSRKLLLFVQKILVVYPLKVFGFNFTSNMLGVLRDGNHSLSFYCPKVVLGYKNNFRKIYGISIDQLITEICFSKSLASKEFSFKILGFGFTLSKCEKLIFESLKWKFILF